MLLVVDPNFNMSGVQAGYKYLKSYKLTVIIYDLTVVFCDRWISKFFRTRDQMVQAGRSGKQNIAEGYKGQSLKSYIKLCGVANASLEELKEDFIDFLRQQGLSFWGMNHPKIREFREFRVVGGPELPQIPQLPQDPTEASGATEKRDQLAGRLPNSWVPDQFSNPDNVAAHQKTVGRELLEQVGVDVKVFVAGVGTGGTLIGVGRALKNAYPEVRLVAVEPTESATLSGGKAGPHQIQGIGDGFIPELVDLSAVDEVVKVSS